MALLNSNYIGYLSHYEYTKYPKIYMGTYWGNHGVEKYNHDPELNKNRNDFVSKYRIKKLVNKYPQWVNKQRAVFDNNFNRKDGVNCDHTEIYYTIDKKYLLLISPYAVDEKVMIEYEKYGFEKVPKMYSESATSFIKFIVR